MVFSSLNFNFRVENITFGSIIYHETLIDTQGVVWVV